MIVWKCPSCGIDARVPDNHGRVNCACGFTQYENPPGLGDRVAATLARIGVTEKRYRKAKTLIGLRGDCGCKKRQQALNAITAKAT